MNSIYATVSLTNEQDLLDAKRHMIGEDEIRTCEWNMLVDTGAIMLCLNESIQEILNLPVLGYKKSTTATGERVTLQMVGPVRIGFDERFSISEALILPGDSEPLLGAIPMEAMDLVVNPSTQTLSGNPKHGGEWILTLKGIR